MKQFTASELRKAWKQFYIDRGHVDCGAVSLVSDGSTGVMFNVAGMQPLMPYLLGKKHPMGTRLCNVQGCVRTIDIDSVGDKSHGTFFEMMGSWSLGDYFKKERCQWSFELLTQLFGFDADHLAATVFAGDDNAPRDEEGAKYRIESGFKPENVYFLPKEENWWGLEYGPCGPDSEMFYVKDVPPCGPNCKPGCDCGKYTEIGNDVFMQYEKHHDGHLTPLAQKNVDTGWGLERILAFLNGVDDVYKIDLHAPVIAYIEKESGIKYEADEKTTRSMRILADHTRTSVMLIGDEAKLLPSNTGAGYILRRLIRRAVRHARTLGLNKDQILGVAKIYIDEYKESYEHLNKNQKFVLTELEREIVRFESTLENGMKEFKKILDKTTAEGHKEISGKDAFFLYDTYGFPVELTVELAQEEGLTVDEEGFKTSMEEQKQKARDNQNFSANLEAGKGVFDGLDESVKVEFLGYDALGCDGTVVAMAGAETLTDELTEGQQGTIITDRTTFYGTMGGQVGDIGEILGANGAKFEVAEAIKVAGGRTAHVGKVVAGSFKTSDKVSLNVDAANRAKTCSNHSATHLLQKALQEVLGDGVEQAGSYQDPDKTRFDFSYHQAMTADEIKKVEDIVNAKIYEGLSVVTKEMSLEEAKKTGAMALFGEKYGDSVRVVNMGDWSIELCGGTHVSNTREIGQFKILSESGVAAGVRRIEAITGTNVIEFYKELERNTKDAAALLKATPETLADHIKKLQEELKAIKSENESLKSSAAKDALGNAADDAVDVKGVKFVAKSLKDVDMNSLRELGDSLKESLGDCVVVLMSDNDGKVSIMTMASDSAVKKGAHAGNLVKEIAPMVGGGGGGRPNMAQAGGKNPAGIADALNKAQEVLAGQIK